jgi:hypothetical protein
MEEEIKDLQEQGETAELPITTSSGGEMESILVLLTSVFLILAVLLIGTQLYTIYGLGKAETKAERIK